MAAFAISAALASLSGSLFAFDFHYLSPEMVSTSRSLEMITMLVVGGEGTLVGSLAGVALLTLLPQLFQPFALYKTLAEGVLLVVTFLYCPMGIFGFLAGRLSQFNRMRAPARSLRLRLSKDKLQ
jgi:branched-chain amino acid transport system permease protein